MPDVWYLVGLGLAVMALAVATEAMTEILIKGSILDIIGLRGWASRKALPPDGDYHGVRWYHTALHVLLTCGYCASVWVAGAAALLAPGGYLGAAPWDSWAVKALVIHRLSNFWHDMYQLWRRGRVHTVDLEVKVSGTIGAERSDARAASGGDGKAGAAPGPGDIQATGSGHPL